MFSRDFRRPKGAKSKYIFEKWVQVVQVVPALWRVHWLQVVGLFGASGPAKRLALVLWSCVPSFCPLSRFVFGVLSLNMVLFRVFRAFLADFERFVWVCVACVLRVACGAFVCVSG